MNRFSGLLSVFLPALMLYLAPQIGHAGYIGEDPPRCCTCETGKRCPELPGTGSGSAISASEGNLREAYTGPRVMSGSGPTLAMDLAYNSYNADGSRANVDTVMGYGWTHSYNIFLFAQRGSMFRFDADGRVTTYKLGPGGTYTAAPGYFETLVKNPDGSFTLTQKDQTRFQFQSIPGTPFMVNGPVWRLTEITDRNGNITTLSYAGGKLTAVTDTYSRSLTLGYNGRNKLTTIQDPLGRITTLQYDTTGRKLVRVTDAAGKSVSYSYNSLYQMTQKVDKDDRTFRYLYQSNKPVAIRDGAGHDLFRLSNPVNWATDVAALFLNLQRVYVPSTTRKTDGLGHVWLYDYDNHGYITKITAPDGAETSYTYDPATLMPASVTDANGHTTRYEYDALGNRIKQIDPVPFNYETAWTYDPVFNRMTGMTDANGRLTSYDIDPANGNRLRETDPLGGIRQWSYDSHGNVLTETDKNGNLSRHDYDAFGNRIKTTDAVGKPEQRQTTYTYDAVGNLKTRTDDNIHTTRYDYDNLNRLLKETDPAGNFTRYDYDGEGNRVRVVDRNGNPTQFQYDLRQRLVKTIYPLPAPKNFSTQSYDGNDNRVDMTDRNGHSSQFDYDLQNRLVKSTDTLNNISTRGYDPVGNLIEDCDANGHCTTYTYDALNRRLTTLDAESDLTQLEYDRVGMIVPNPRCPDISGPSRGSSLVTRQIDANGKVSYFKYDGLDRLVCQIRKQIDTADSIDADDAVTRYGYDANGNRLALTEPNGNATSYVYDGLNRLVQETNAAGDQTLTTYDGVDNVITVTAPNFNVTTHTYDALDRLIQVNDSVGRVANYGYDPEGNRLSERDGNGNGTDNVYDSIYRLIQVTDALGHNTFYDYDAVGNLLQITDRALHATCYHYDDINRRILAVQKVGDTDCTEVDVDDIWTKTDYDHVGNVTALTTAKNGSSPAACNGASPPADCETTSYAYDGVNRLLRETYPDPAPNIREFSYDGVGNLLTRTDQKGQVTQYRYSDLYFLTERIYPVSPADTLSYDLSGRMLSAERDGWLVTFDYDGANRVTETSQNGRVVSYVHDIPGRTRTITYPGGRVVTESMDPRARLSSVNRGPGPVFPITQIALYNYDLGNRVQTRQYENGVIADYTYNANNWITGLEHTIGSTLIAGFGHDYDAEGNKLYEDKTHDGGHSEAYQYDEVYRLIDYKVGTLIGSSVPVPLTQSQYDLDKLGNWDHKVKDGVTQTREHNAVNEITSIQVDGNPLVPIGHDDNGNLEEDKRYSYAYDEENRLTGVTRKSDGKPVGQYRYDALSRRITKIANPALLPSVPIETHYFYDDARIVEEQDIGGATLATYVYGNYIDEVLSMARGGQDYYYHQNALWSVAAVTDALGNAVERYSYDAYGYPIITDGSGVAVPPNAWGTAHSAIASPWMFTGRQWDEETGIYFYRARYYDPFKGRFLGRDPLGYFGGVNLYEYIQGRPATLVDPYGLKKIWGWKHIEGVSVDESPTKWFGPYLKSEDRGCITHWWGHYGIEMTNVARDCSTDTIEVKGSASSSYYTSALFGSPLFSTYLHASEEGTVTVKCDNGNIKIVGIDGKRETERKLIASVLIQARIEGQAITMTVDVKTGYAETITKATTSGWKFAGELDGVKAEYNYGTSVTIDESSGKTWGENKSRLYECTCCEVPE
ncbi:RHS repeat-associated core domain-containing protein [Methylomonas sp. MgM2]